MRNKIAIIDDTRSITYKQMDQYVRRYAQKIRGQGILPGNTAIIAMPDCIEWVIAFLGCLHAGVIPVVVSAQMQTRKLKQAIATSKSSLVLTNEQRNNIIIEQGIELPIAYDFGDNEEAFWLTSSGTTGEQKYIVHKYKSLEHYYNLVKLTFGINNTSVVFASPRLSFGYGLGINVILSLKKGATIILTEKILSHKLLAEKIIKFGITHFFSTPVFLSPLVKNNKKFISAIKTLKVVTSAGETISKNLKQKFKEMYDKDILNGYGLSEVVSYVCTQTEKNQIDTDYRNIGKVLAGISYEIRDTKGNICPRYVQGDLYIKHPCTALFYYTNYRKSKKILKDDWIKTNDIVYENKHNELIYVSRRDNLIKINGQYVSIDEVESAMMSHDKIKECLVYTNFNKLNILELKAKVIIRSAITAGEIRKFLKDKIEIHQIPKRIFFVDSLPNTVTQKKIRKHSGTIKRKI